MKSGIISTLFYNYNIASEMERKKHYYYGEHLKKTEERILLDKVD
jgi:hypothetical protein